MDLDVVSNMNQLLILYYDNNGVVAKSKESTNHKWEKHIEHNYHFQEIMHWGDAAIKKIASKNNVADLVTKTLPNKSFEGSTRRDEVQRHVPST